MRMTFRLSVLALLATILLAGVSVAYPSWVRESGLDFWEAPALRQELNSLYEEEKKIDQLQTLIAQRIRYKEALLERLLSGHCSLAYVVEEFYQLNQAYPEIMSNLRQQYDGPTDRIKLAKNVMDFANIRSRDHMGRNGTRIASVQLEYRSYIEEQIRISVED